jgi:hypothetical protein
MRGMTRVWKNAIEAIAVAALLTLAAPGASPQGIPLPDLLGALPGSGEVLLRLNGGEELLQPVLGTYGLTELLGTPRLRQRGWYRVKLPATQLLAPVLALLRADARVRDALPNLTLAAAEADPYFARQWNLQSARISEVWASGPVGSGVTVALLDTGISPGPDLAKTWLLPGYDFVNDDADASDDHQHGTMMASILASAVGNGHATAGVAPEVGLLPVKVLNHKNRGSTSALVEGLYYAAEQGAQIVNLSLAYPTASYPGAVLDEALEELEAEGVLVVAAAGNFGTATVAYPAAHPSTIAVAASQPLSGFAGEERAPYSSYGTAVDLRAPGGGAADVDSDGRIDGVLGETFDPEQAGRYQVWVLAGTSGATAQVSGVAALLLSAAATGTVSAADVRAALEAGAAHPPGVEFEVQSGVGQLDAAAALQALLTGPGAGPPAYTTSVELREELVLNVFPISQLGLWHRGVADVQVHHASGAAAAGVWVWGHFAGASGSSRSLKTDAAGRARFVSTSYRTDWGLLHGLKFVVDRVTATGGTFESDGETSWLASPSGALWLLLAEGLEWLMTPLGHDWLGTPAGGDWLSTDEGLSWLLSSDGMDWLATPAGHDWLATPAGHDWLATPAGHDWLATPAGHDWSCTPAD